MELPDRVLATFASQLGNPRGLPGRVLGRLLNRANRAVITGAVGALDLPSDGVAADLGFGGGAGLDVLLCRLGASGQVHGIDQSATMLSAAAHRFRHEVEGGRLTLHQAPIEHLPLETSSLDGIITLNTIYFVAELAGALQEFARVLKPGGQIVIGLDDPQQMARQSVARHGFRVRPLAEVTNGLLAAGLEVDQHRPIGSGRDLFHLLVARPCCPDRPLTEPGEMEGVRGGGEGG